MRQTPTNHRLLNNVINQHSLHNPLVYKFVYILYIRINFNPIYILDCLMSSAKEFLPMISRRTRQENVQWRSNWSNARCLRNALNNWRWSCISQSTRLTIKVLGSSRKQRFYRSFSFPGMCDIYSNDSLQGPAGSWQRPFQWETFIVCSYQY